ncbi:MAG: ABC transporter ATP-binding protein [Acidobacteria bacterium]|nr:ABC transporter ATP-binding protein [Acidobacteriota bacterium]
MTLLDVDFEFRYPPSTGSGEAGREGASVACRWRDPVGEPRVTVFLGASGSGKTTVLRCLAGLERPQRGHVRFGDHVWFDAERRVHLPPDRRDVGVLFQEYALFPHLTVAQNIAFGARHLTHAAVAARVGELLDTFRLRGLEGRRPRQLSGGQQQRVALARAVFRVPKLLLLDEPLSAVDRPTGDELREELRSLIRALAIPAYIVSHDRVDALTLADRTVLIDGGRIIQSGTTQEVFDHPASAAAARLVGVDTILLGRIAAVEDGLARIIVAGREVRAQAPAEAGHEAALCIRAEDVALARHDVTDSSVMNRWRATIVTETMEGPFVRVGLDCGFRLSALVTRDAWRRLALKPGDDAWAIVKAATIRSLPRN